MNQIRAQVTRATTEEHSHRDAWLLGSQIACVLEDRASGSEMLVPFPGVGGSYRAEWQAVNEWCEWHGIDPRRIPAGTRVVRDADACCIRFVTVAFDRRPGHEFDYNGGARLIDAVEQGEAPPLPFPPVLARWLRRPPPPVDCDERRPGR